MIKKYIYGGMLTLLLVGAVVLPNVTRAETTSSDAMLEQIKVLMAKVEELQKQLATIRGEVKSLIKENLAEGMTDADIAKLQELLATDPTIYPEGKKTGYFGPLTREAVKRFQARHGLEVTGKIDKETHDLLEEYLHDVYGDKIPAGLLTAPGIAKKMEARMGLRCEKGERQGMGFFCKKWKMEHGDDDDEDEMEDEDDDSNDDGFDVEVEVEDGDTTVSFKVDGVSKEVTVKNSTDLEEVLDAIADKIKDGDDASDLDEDLADEIEAELEDAVDDAEDADVENDANDALDDAEQAIDDARDAIEDADGDTSDAEDALNDAEDKLAEAEDALDDEEFEDAKDLADEAKNLADDAVDLLDEA